MEIRVAAPDVASAKALVWRLAMRRSIASLDADSHQVRVRAWGDAPTVGEVLETVLDWLEENEIDSVSIWLEDAEHLLERPEAQIASAR